MIEIRHITTIYFNTSAYGDVFGRYNENGVPHKKG